MDSFDAEAVDGQKIHFIASLSHRLNESNLIKSKMKLIKKHEKKFVQ